MLSSLRSTPGNRSRSARNAVAAALFALLGGGALAACAQEGATPACDNNVSQNGVAPDQNGTGCEHFGLCKSGGSIDPTAMKCCVDSDGNLLGGGSLAACLYGFGAQCCKSVKSSPDRTDQYVFEDCDATAVSCCGGLGADEASCLAGFRVGEGGSGGTGGSTGGSGGTGGTTGP